MNIDCGNCPNVTSGCKDVCMRVETPHSEGGEKVSDAYEVPTCQKCGVEYSLREGAEPSTYCDECAHVKVDELERELAQLQSKLAESESRIVYLSKWTDRNAAGERIASLEAELKTEKLARQSSDHQNHEAEEMLQMNAKEIARLLAELKTERENGAKLRKLGDDACRWRFCVKHGFPERYWDDSGELLWAIYEHDGYPGPEELVDALLDAQIAIDADLGSSHASE